MLLYRKVKHCSWKQRQVVTLLFLCVILWSRWFSFNYVQNSYTIGLSNKFSTNFLSHFSPLLKHGYFILTLQNLNVEILSFFDQNYRQPSGAGDTDIHLPPPHPPIVQIWTQFTTKFLEKCGSRSTRRKFMMLMNWSSITGMAWSKAWSIPVMQLISGANISVCVYLCQRWTFFEYLILVSWFCRH